LIDLTKEKYVVITNLENTFLQCLSSLALC